MSSSSFSRRFLERKFAASSITERRLSTEGLELDGRLLLCWPRRHLVVRLDRGAMLVLARVAVADLTPATRPMEEVHEFDFTWRERAGFRGDEGLLSKSSSVQR